MPGTAIGAKVVGDIAYVQTISMGGRGRALPDALLTLVDIHDHTEPRIIASLPYGDFDVVDNVLYMPDEKQGLQVWQVSTTAKPQLLTSPIRKVRHALSGLLAVWPIWLPKTN